jgi:glutathione peroxidase
VISIKTLSGESTTLEDLTGGKAALVVNVASKCGLTPQYTALEQLQREYSGRGFTVVGAPCNQFGGQEPGSADDIQTFCSTTYGVSFPMTEKLEVNGPGKHPLYAELTEHADDEGKAGDVQWNFEKFLLSPEGKVVARFRPTVEPGDPKIRTAIESLLNG